MSDYKKQIDRRHFFGSAAAIGAFSAFGIGAVLNSCSGRGNSLPQGLPPLLEKAPDGDMLKAGIIGCGGRGTGAALNFLNAGPNLTIAAMGDMFEDRLAESRQRLKEKADFEISDDKCFLGFDAFKRVLEEDVDIVILATPPYFRPEHFKAAVEARKHVFMEKPIAVDPVGIRSVIASSKRADNAGLSVITGTQRRHQRDYIETYKQIYNDAIGDLVAANCYWNQGKLWHKDDKPEWTEMEYMLRDWVNWRWLSGDHIVEQHIHNIDVINWFMDKFPEKAVGFGSRHRRPTGDQYDNFSIDFVYEGNIHLHSMCRQINDCANGVYEYMRGTKGYTNCKNTVHNPDGSILWEFAYPTDENGQESGLTINGYYQEHIDLVTAIRTNKPVNEAERTAKSNLTAIMGRTSAYTGKEITMEEMMQSEMALGPAELKMGKVDMKVEVPVPGTKVEGS